MRAGDALLLILLALVLTGLAVDALTGGAIGAWLQAHLSGLGRQAGAALGWIGLILSPLLAVPLLAAVWGRFAGLPGALAEGLRRSALAIDAVSTAIADMTRWAALALVVVTAVIVIQRYVFGLSFTRLQESVIYLHSALFLLSSAAALLNGSHVRVDIFYSRLSMRARAWTNLAGTYLALMPMCILILITSSGYVGAAWRILERSREGDGLPLVFLLKTLIPVFAVMMILQGASMAARAALTLAGRTAPPSPGEYAGQEL
ncbi:TRAP transporter small permease subunit [Alkalicaulis satelles]|uniref:TRAP transporter small permease protein n=1 Tax=Alkalicaulis satelles TaxID=2609175 RepID=A0A5M6ZJ52_9PROT|nr:TRAP transporter small permease subunit [Alkalicaulis satelles]KAA5804842.1 TRAP transporter small permease subunit [Alkalicaulis satelles]